MKFYDNLRNGLKKTAERLPSKITDYIACLLPDISIKNTEVYQRTEKFLENELKNKRNEIENLGNQLSETRADFNNLRNRFSRYIKISKEKTVLRSGYNVLETKLRQEIEKRDELIEKGVKEKNQELRDRYLKNLTEQVTSFVRFREACEDSYKAKAEKLRDETNKLKSQLNCSRLIIEQKDQDIADLRRGKEKSKIRRWLEKMYEGEDKKTDLGNSPAN